MEDLFVSVSQAAKIKNVTRQAVYLAIKLKRLKAYKIDEKWLIYKKDLQEYDERRYSREFHSSFYGKPIFDDEKGYVSVDKASLIIGVPKQKIYYAIRRRILPAKRKKAAYVLYVEDLMKYKFSLEKKELSLKSVG